MLALAGMLAFPAALYPLSPAPLIPEAGLSSVLVNGFILAGYYGAKTFSLPSIALLFSAAIVLCRRSYALSAAGIRVLYLAPGDGSDLRTGREITSLACAGATIDFVGMGGSPSYCNVPALPAINLYLVKGARLSPHVFFRYLACSASLLVRRRYHSVHIAGEMLLPALWPFLWLQRQVVADLSEPARVRPGLAAIGSALLRKCLYLPVTTLIVADESHFRLSPDAVKKKTLIVPDFPTGYDGPVASQPQPTLTILCYGQLGKGWGTEIVSGLLDSGKPVHILMAGRIRDKIAEQLTLHPAVKWMGSRSHGEILKIAATQSDFLLRLCSRPGDKYTSLSGLYDAIQVEKPAIMNAEILTAGHAGCYPAGFVIPASKVTEFDSLYDSLLQFRTQFIPLKKLREGWVWSKVEKKLIYAHRL